VKIAPSTETTVQENSMHDVAARPIRTSSVQRLARLSLALGALLGLACDPVEPLRLDPGPDLPVQAMHFEPNAAALQSITVPQQPAAPQTADTPLGEVFWTAHEPKSPQQQAAEWGLQFSDLLALNPEIADDPVLAEGTRLKVYQPDPERPTQSVGAPNRGKLINGMPIPEGEHWRLRSMRRRAYGSELTVNALVSAFNAYGERFPGAPKIRVGELAQRKGGKISPHRSHRSGRDVDLGYIALGEDDGDVRWQLMNASNLDVEKNWYLIHEMIKSGDVESIFISSRLQPLLYAEAKRHLTEEELSGLFQYPRSAPGSKDAVIRHWSGHRNHMHVRFRCEDWNSRCRSRGR
jgi:murein endopeptidase